MKVSSTTMSLSVLAAASVVLVHADPWHAEGPRAAFVSTRSAARRVFPALADASQDAIEIVLEPASGPRIALVPDDRGIHRVEQGGEEVGPADPHAVEGLLASLRIATTLRAVSTEPRPGDGVRGSISVTTPQGSATVALLGASPDRAGVYATLREDEARSSWVVEQEIADLLELPAEAWLSRRLVPIQVSEVGSLAIAGTEIRRGDDEIWRVRSEAGAAWLSTAAVEARLERMLSAPLRPWLPQARERAAWSEAFAITARDGRVWTILSGGACPGDDSKVIVSRGGGWPGCISREWVERWPEPIGDALEPRLFPHDLARVLRFEQRLPVPIVLRRHQGDWRLVLASGEERPAAGEEVARFYAALQTAEVEIDPSGTPATPALLWHVVTDAAVAYDLACDAAADGWRCRRDDGAWLRLRHGAPPPALDPDLFAERTLAALEPGEAIAIELFDRADGGTLRQSAHLDLGVWRLDAPVHPDGDEALSELALEELLATAGGLRASAWTAIPAAEPRRRIAIERRPRRGQPSSLEIAVFDDCVVAVEGRGATIDAPSCTRLHAALLHRDPISHWIATARRIELWRDSTPVGAWSREAGTLEPVPAELGRWSALADASVVPGPPPPGAEVLGELRVHPRNAGPEFTLRLGETWAQLQGADWHYRWSDDAPGQ